MNQASFEKSFVSQRPFFSRLLRSLLIYKLINYEWSTSNSYIYVYRNIQYASINSKWDYRISYEAGTMQAACVPTLSGVNHASDLARILFLSAWLHFMGFSAEGSLMKSSTLSPVSSAIHFKDCTISLFQVMTRNRCWVSSIINIIRTYNSKAQIIQRD